MKIIHYLHGLPPVRTGGLVNYVVDLVKAQSGSAEAVLLTPGPVSPRASERSRVLVKAAGSYAGIPRYSIRNPLPIPMANGIQDTEWYRHACDPAGYREFLEELKPDIIHVHTLMGIHKEFFDIAVRMGIPLVFTTHDYFGLCPVANMMCGQSVCESPGAHCAECSRYAFSRKRLLLEQSRVYELYRKSDVLIRLLRTDALKGMLAGIRSRNPEQAAELAAGTGEQALPMPERREEYQRLLDYYRSMFGMVSYFHFNSSVARGIYERLLGPLKGSVEGVRNSRIADRREFRAYGKILRIGFLGGDVPHKGLRRLRKVMDELYTEEKLRDMELQVYGCRDVREYPFCRYHDAYRPDQIGEVFAGMDILAVPSYWPETFGMVVLEALSYGVPVVVTEKVGAKDILADCPKEIGVVTGDSEGELKAALRGLYQNREKLSAMNRNILEADMELDYAAHVEKIFAMYESL